MSARLLSSVRGSLFLIWAFFVCTASSSVSGCLRILLLKSVTHLDLRFSLSDRVAHWDESLMFLFAPSSSTPVVSSGFCRMFPGCHLCFCLQDFLSSFLFLPGFVPPSIGGCRSRHLFYVFLFVRPYWIIGCFCLSCPLPFFSFLHGVLCCFLPYFGISPFRVAYLSPSPSVSPRLVPLGFVLIVLVPVLSFGLFFSLVHPRRIACFSLGPFLRFLVTGSSLLVPLRLSFSPLGVSCLFLVFFS